MRRQRDGVRERLQRAQRQRRAGGAVRDAGRRAGGWGRDGRGGRSRFRRGDVVRHAPDGRLRDRDGPARDGADGTRHDPRRDPVPGAAATRAVKALLALAAGVLAGLVAGAIWTWVQADRYRADARVLVRPPSSRIVPAVEALAESSLVEANVAQTLHLSSPPNVSAAIGKGGVLTVSVEAGSRERARQIDAEAVVILTQKVDQRFGVSPGVTTTLLDPAHAAEQTSPTPGRNFLVAGLIGLAAGLLTAFALRGARRPVASGDPGIEPRLRARIDEVAKRERALARRAGELAAREQELDCRQEELAAAASRPSPSDQGVARREQELGRRQQELERRIADQQRGLEQRAADLSAREAELQVPPARASRLGWDLQVLEKLVRQQEGTADPADLDEWSAYLFFLREHADHDGMLPPSFDALIADVFGKIPGVLWHGDPGEA